MKQLVTKIALLLGVSFGILALLNYLLDPFQILSARPEGNFGMTGTQRYHFAGIIRHYDFDRIIIGTSMSENFLPSLVDKQFGYGTTLNAAISGASVYEQSRVLSFALEQAPVKEIIWGIDFPSFLIDNKDFPDYLYSNNPFALLQYLIDPSVVRMAAKDLLASMQRKILSKSQNNLYDKFTYYWANAFEFSEEQILKVWEDYKKKETSESTYDIDELKDSFRHTVLQIIMSNRDKQFYVFFPPYSILYFVFLKEKSPAIFDCIMSFKQYIIESLKPLDNVSIIDFQSRCEIICDLNNYKDIWHFSGEISNMIIEELATHALLQYSQSELSNEAFYECLESFTDLYW